MKLWTVRCRVIEESGVHSDNDAGIRGSKVLSRIGVEAGLMAATMGTANVALKGGRAAVTPVR